MKRAPRDPELAQRWQAFVRNHRDAIAAMDFFTVPTVTFQLLYCFFIISHERGQIVHGNVTRHPTSTRIAQQLREAFLTNPLPASCSSITTKNMVWKYPLPFAPCKSWPCKPQSKAPGKTVLRNAG